uniref:Uncharacterized protein n=1 Tax=Grammatophora oceanica TaxID=210454 RepID=A0A7S1Y5B9_9STRA|mmetsp:Transcript_21410/g.31882  ORF Transcript_21410/g.31882 Transcript_21410/m.31882 type:complete len:153 (+) Transcript_21410:100-558(+)
MAGAYQRVAASEEGSSTGRNRSSDRVFDKIYALIWVILAVLVARWTKFFHVLFSDDRVLQPVMHLAAVCLGINTILLLYLTVYLPKFNNIKDSAAWDVFCPRVVPTMSFVGVLCFLFLIRGTWPVWGFLSPLILGTETLGALFAMHFVPWFA